MEIPIDYRVYNIEESFGTWVVTTARMLHGRLLENFKTANFYDVTLEQWIVLVRLWSKDGLCQYELAVGADKNQTYITRLLDTLEKRNLIVRVPHPSDRRAKQIYLTQQGRELTKELIEVAQKTLGEALKDIDEQELENCRDVLKKVRKNLSML